MLTILIKSTKLVISHNFFIKEVQKSPPLQNGDIIFNSIAKITDVSLLAFLKIVYLFLNGHPTRLALELFWVTVTFTISYY